MHVGYYLPRSGCIRWQGQAKKILYRTHGPHKQCSSSNNVKENKIKTQSMPYMALSKILSCAVGSGLELLSCSSPNTWESPTNQTSKDGKKCIPHSIIAIDGWKVWTMICFLRNYPEWDGIFPKQAK